MNRVLTLFLIIGIAFLLPVHALQAVDAENLVVQGNYLEVGEKAAVFKALPETSGGQKYWVVSILQNDSVRVVIPVTDKDSSIVGKGTLRTNLISSNILTQRITALKNASTWLMTLPTSNKLDELSNAIENEQFDVDIVSEQIDQQSLKASVGVLKGTLVGMSDDVKSISQNIKELSEKETLFLNVSIDAGIVNNIFSEYTQIYDAIESVKQGAAEYDQDISQIKNQIASLDGVDAQTKSQLLGLLSPLGPNQTLSSAISPYADLAADNRQRLSTEVAALTSKTSALEAELETRLSRVKAYAELYGEDESLEKKTGFSTLNEAAQTILAEENKSQWADQPSVIKLQGAWENAEEAFGKKQYATALDLGVKAKVLVKQIHSAGIEETVDPTSQVSDTLITGLALVLGGIAAILLIRKFAQMVKVAPKEE
ncbi:MAG: hypothetical protein AABX02_03105 [archaeon]